MLARARLVAAHLAVSLTLLASGAHATPRPFFEPTDLEMNQPGELDVALQYGVARSQDAWRVVAPDVELDFGLTKRFELDLDWTFAGEAPGNGRSSWHPAPDNLWPSLKAGLCGEASMCPIGLQLGPKIAVAPGARGIGVEGLLLVSLGWPGMGDGSHLVLNLGGLIDPRDAGSGNHPAGVEGGLDLNLRLGHSDFSLTSELAVVHFRSVEDADQLHATAGVTWTVYDKLDVSVVALKGFLSGGDQDAIMVGITPKVDFVK